MLVDNILVPAAESNLSNLIAKVTKLVDAVDAAGWNTYDIDKISQIVYSLGD